ncbi:hypothetical protein AKJ48_01240 [candidate division MSBL1 archaeon SCGC-AAA261O19]|uniref:KaiC domain-containing protein n=1 Tax=candidate division MSBL1 archaeon SCGC-AAA261O19 TaxID=1698277 RepID=A0A133VEK1_9EURY|nr:hypothetical protein AKJ48_01240 [candidate division MSBL1 archaeon SCGC-AAA261O19]
MVFGEPGVFISLEREPDALREDARHFGWNLKPFENQGNLELMGGPLDRVVEFRRKVGASGEDLIGEIIQVVQGMGAERLALDGLTQFSTMFPDTQAFRSGLVRLQRELNELTCTSILTSEVEEGKGGLSRLGVEEYVADGVITLHYERSKLFRSRALEVRKMRGTDHSNHLSFFEISDEGIRIRRGKDQDSEGE